MHQYLQVKLICFVVFVNLFLGVFHHLSKTVQRTWATSSHDHFNLLVIIHHTSVLSGGKSCCTECKVQSTQNATTKNTMQQSLGSVLFFNPEWKIPRKIETGSNGSLATTTPEQLNKSSDTNNYEERKTPIIIIKTREMIILIRVVIPPKSLFRV